jgi:hypothetical protein
MGKTAGQVLIEEALPPDLRGEVGTLDKSGLKAIHRLVAERHPADYREVSRRLHEIGGRVAFESGGYSPGLSDLIAPPEVEAVRTALRHELEGVLADPAVSAPDRAARILAITKKYRDPLVAAVKESTRDNAFGKQVRSTAKGNWSNVQALLAGELGYEDQAYRPIPFPVTRSFGEGVDPHEYAAGTFGARQGVTTLKLCLDRQTPVMMADFTTKPVGLVEPGEWVIGVRRDGRATPTRVLARHDNGVRRCVTATFYPRHNPHRARTKPRPLTVVCTPDHRFLTATPTAASYSWRGAVKTRKARTTARLAQVDWASVLAVFPSRRDDRIQPYSEELGALASQMLLVGQPQLAIPDDFALWGRISAWRFLKGLLKPLLKPSTRRLGGRSWTAYAMRAVDPAVTARLANVLRFVCGVQPVRIDRHGYLSVTGRFACRRLEEVLTVARADKSRGFKAFLDVKLESTEDAGYRETCDLEVDNGSHLFLLGNGLVASNSTAVGGYFQKRLRHATGRLAVVAPDGPQVGTLRGLPVDTADPDNEGAVLAAPAGDLPKGTVLSHAALSRLQDGGVDRILVRSPMVGGPPDGVYARDVGAREGGDRMPQVGTFPGPQAADAVAAPAVQSLISAKHSGGVAGGSTAQQGFPVMDRLASIPELFPGGAAHARVEGRVRSVAPAPQGGHLVDVGGETHYAAPDRQVRVKEGDEVEAGDPLTDGVHHPAVLVEHKGIGEGSKRFVESFMQAAHAAGFHPNRRNLELLARGLIDHVTLHQEYGPFVPGDVVSYRAVEHAYRPREDAREVDPRLAVGKYLEVPVLHHTIGTRVAKSMLPDLKAFGVDRVTVHPDPPPFTATMVRSHDVPNQDADWMARMLGSHLSKHLIRGVHRGDVASLSGTSMVAPVASGLVWGAGTPKPAPAGPPLKPALKAPV